ncbi:hypothetical protein Elgi_01380 [Paenibacillus elgii]|nr:hypothetical protein Elgi_01380 [Paenibacillus elgii]
MALQLKTKFGYSRSLKGDVMERKLNLLFGIFGGIMLICIRLPSVNFYSVLENFQGFISSYIAQILSPLGLLVVIYFSIVLIIDCLKSEIKRKRTKDEEITGSK